MSATNSGQVLPGCAHRGLATLEDFCAEQLLFLSLLRISRKTTRTRLDNNRCCAEKPIRVLLEDTHTTSANHVLACSCTASRKFSCTLYIVRHTLRNLIVVSCNKLPYKLINQRNNSGRTLKPAQLHYHKSSRSGTLYRILEQVLRVARYVRDG